MAVQVPDRGVHAGFLANGLTRYSYDEIVSAIQEFEECERENNGLVNQAAEITKPHDYIGGMFYAPAHIQELDKYLKSTPGISIGGGGKEQWPVKTWQKEIIRYRSLNRKLRKSLDSAEALQNA